MSKSYKTSKRHFKLFKKECRYWLDKFDLGSWKVVYFHEDVEDSSKGNAAWQSANWRDRLCSLGLDINWGKNEKPTKKRVAEAAFHEVCELLIYMLRIIADFDAKPTGLHDVENYNHSIIRRLEKAIWEPYWDARQ